MAEKFLLDNVLIYAHDRSAGRRHKVPLRLGVVAQHTLMAYILEAYSHSVHSLYGVHRSTSFHASCVGISAGR